MPESGRSVSLWQSAPFPLVYSPLLEDVRCDVCVVGAGMAGLSIALRLACERRSVVVLDDGAVGGGASLRTTGHLASGLDDRYYRLERLHGTDGVRLAAESHAAAIDEIEATCRRESIACDFARVDGYLVAAQPGADGSEEIDREFEAARDAGLRVALVERPPIGTWDFGLAVRFADQGQFHAGKYLAGLARAVVANGARIHTGVHATAIHGGSDAHVETGSGPCVSCNSIVVATNTPINDRVVLHTKQAAYRTYVIALRVPRARLPALLLWDAGEPYHYVRRQILATDMSQAWLIVGGEDHKTGQDANAEDRFAALHAWTRQRFGAVGEPEFRWSGQVLEPHDGLAFIGRNPLDDDNVFVVTGDSGNGLTHGAIAGRLIPDLIAGRENPWARLYEPSRVTLRAAGTFVKETANFVGYYRDLVTAGEIASADELRAGDGGVLRDGLHKVAIHRDADGGLHVHSAVCPHLGCIVHWNGVERTWDCPCHGSRFDAIDGHVINGPANSGLAPATIERDPLAHPARKTGTGGDR